MGLYDAGGAHRQGVSHTMCLSTGSPSISPWCSRAVPRRGRCHQLGEHEERKCLVFELGTMSSAGWVCAGDPLVWKASCSHPGDTNRTRRCTHGRRSSSLWRGAGLVWRSHSSRRGRVRMERKSPSRRVGWRTMGSRARRASRGTRSTPAVRRTKRSLPGLHARRSRRVCAGLERSGNIILHPRRRETVSLKNEGYVHRHLAGCCTGDIERLPLQA